MENKSFFIQYLDNQPVEIETHFNGEVERKRPLDNVSKLIAAVKQALPSKLGTIDLDELTLHFVLDGVEMTYNSWNSITAIGNNGTTGLNPLVIKSKSDVNMDINYDWSHLSSFFTREFSDINETIQVVETDRQVKFKSKELRLFYSDQWRLESGRLPDMRFQDINFETDIQKRVDSFMGGNELVGLLIGPTGCGKTHEIINRAKKQFTIFIDARSYPALDDSDDASLFSLKESFESITSKWKKPNQSLPQLYDITYAFLLSRVLFLKYLKEKYPNITPAQFLIHQLFNSRAIRLCFLKLKLLSLDKLNDIHCSYIDDDLRCLFCFDQAHVLAEHLGSTIISSMEGNHIQQNGDVNEDSKRGTLSVLLYVIKNKEFAKKVIFAGTSSKLRNIDNFKSFGTKPTVLTDNYRPRILENFVYDLFSAGINDNDSATAQRIRLKKQHAFSNINDIVEESYNAVIGRFTRMSIEPIARTIRAHSHTQIMLKLILSSMMTTNHGPIYCQLDKNQEYFFMNTVGSIHLIRETGGYFLSEGYVIDLLLNLFRTEFQQFNLLSSLDILSSIAGTKGKKLQQKEHHSKPSFWLLPTIERKAGDGTIISDRPTGVFFRPSSQFRPDILAFLSKQVCVFFFIKADRPTNNEAYLKWQQSISDTPLKFSIRFLIELPEPLSAVSTENTYNSVEGNQNVVVVVSKSNMRNILSEQVASFVEFITSS
ncbi:hypothetical protein O5D80_000854 [Batrachochytrium dendrobatidis]|nr:hypothetical protein O5D80_000854 [Batrachochytrium dendrobatidis]